MGEHERISEQDFEAASERGSQALVWGPPAVSARYEGGRVRQVVVELDNDCAFAFPVDQTEGLAGASDDDLSEIELTPTGHGLHWPRLDADVFLPGAMQGVSGSRQWQARIGR